MLDERRDSGTIATVGKTKGHPKDIQGLMRHSRL